MNRLTSLPSHRRCVGQRSHQERVKSYRVGPPSELDYVDKKKLYPKKKVIECSELRFWADRVSRYVSIREEVKNIHPNIQTFTYIISVITTTQAFVLQTRVSHTQVLHEASSKYCIFPHPCSAKSNLTPSS